MMFFVRSRWRNKGFVKWPMPFNSTFYHGNTYPEMFTQFRQATSDAFDRKNAIASLIALLAGSVSPFAISRCVSFRIIKTLYRKTCRTITHVLKEALERLSPSFAYSNSTTSVIFPSCIIWIVASLNHCGPRTIGAIANGHSVNLSDFTFEASTGLCVTGKQMIIPSNETLGTFTDQNTSSNCIAVWSYVRGGIFNDFCSSESSAYKGLSSSGMKTQLLKTH